MRSWSSLRTVLLLAASVLASVAVHAASPPTVVIAVDATLGASDRAEADASIAALVHALPDDGEIGLIVFDEVVRHVVPLAAADAGQRDDVMKALRPSGDRATSGNLAAGLERGIDELDGRGSTHLLLFANARMAAMDEESGARFRSWYREILLPDAAERDIAVTLVSPDAGADAALLADLESHPGNARHSLGRETDLAATLQRRVLDGQDGGDAPTIVAGLETTTDDAATGTGTADANAAAEPADPALSSDRRRLSRYVVAAWLLAALALLLVALLRRRRPRAQRPAEEPDTQTGNTSSSYLPLHTSDPRLASMSRPPCSTTPSTPVASAPHETFAPVEGGDATERTRIKGRDDVDELELLETLTAERTATDSLN